MLASSVRAPHNEAIAAASANAIRSGVQITTHTELETPVPGPGAGRVLPVLPRRDWVVCPQMVIQLLVGREKSSHALDRAMEGDKRILLLAQKSAETDDPEAGDLYEVGTLAQVLQLLKLPDGTIKVLVEEIGSAPCRARMCQYV